MSQERVVSIGESVWFVVTIRCRQGVCVCSAAVSSGQAMSGPEGQFVVS
jgi:hypothetical protein